MFPPSARNQVQIMFLMFPLIDFQNFIFDQNISKIILTFPCLDGNVKIVFSSAL